MGYLDRSHAWVYASATVPVRALADPRPKSLRVAVKLAVVAAPKSFDDQANLALMIYEHHCLTSRDQDTPCSSCVYCCCRSESRSSLPCIAQPSPIGDGCPTSRMAARHLVHDNNRCDFALQE